ncbi:MAG TPA: hypothetical protein VLR50_01520 [Desulfobacterales bacterium]|nr:hypothetical protein [Desulfobacterales bacterium]
MVSVIRTLVTGVLLCISITLSPLALAQTAAQAVDRETALAIEGLETDKENLLVQIKKCEKTIANANAIISAAKGKGNSSAAEIATKAAITAEDARRSYENTLRIVDEALASLRRAREPLSEQEKRRAKARLAEIRLEISKLQGLLRTCIEATTQSISEREKLENQIDLWYNLALKTAKQDLFLECGTFGLRHVLKARKATALENIVNSEKNIRVNPHPIVESQNMQIIDKNRSDIALIDYNASLVEHLNDLHTAHDLYVWNQKAAYSTETLAGAADLLAGILFKSYGMAKIGTIGGLGVLSELSAWQDLRQIDKQNRACSDQVKPIAASMQNRVKEVGCLEECLDSPRDGCVDKCRGKTSASAPPPPAN